MSITLSDGTTTLTLNHVLWSNRSADQVAGSERVTIGGRLVSQRLATRAGREIILEARLEGNSLRGWFTGTQVAKFKQWRDNATTLTLTYDTTVRSAVIPLSGISIEPVLPRSTAIDGADICAGTLTLLEV
jgi:hypothetical protein